MRKPKQFNNHFSSFGEAIATSMFRAICSHVVDGDTADFFVDLGWYNYAYLPVRFKNVDTPETRGTTGAERDLALKAKDKITELLLNTPVLIKTSKEISFGRFSGDIYFIPSQNLDLSGLPLKPFIKDNNVEIQLISIVDWIKKEKLTTDDL